jgi:hypothetical protein
VYPEGLTTVASDDEINVSFRPTPNYAALAEAATGSGIDRDSIQDKSDAWMHGVRVRTVREMTEALKLASARVEDKEKGMLIEVLM